MNYHDKQHYVPQSYLRNFSPDLEEYMKIRENLDGKQKRKYKARMKIHFYDLDTDSIGYGNIDSLAKVDHYLFPAVDEIVRKTESKLSLLREIISNQSEDFLYENDNQNTLWEIANCLVAKSIWFREFTELYNLRTTGNMVDNDGNALGSITFTKESAEFFQTMFFTDNPEILYPMMLKSMRIKMPLENIDGTFEQIFEQKNIEKTPYGPNPTIFPIQTIIPRPIYPCLIFNQTEFPLITGDACVPKTEFVLPDKKTRVPVYHFPLNSDLAIIFVEENEHREYIPRKITYRWDTFVWNRLMYNCSTHYLFCGKPYQLGTVTSYPKDPVDLDRIIRTTQVDRDKEEN